MKNMKIVLALMSILFLTSTQSNAIVIRNDLHMVADADPAYAGFKDAHVYVNGIEVPTGHTIDAGEKTEGYTIEIDIPAHFAQNLAGEKLSSFWSAIYRLVRCFLNFVFVPTYEAEEYSVAEMIIQLADAREKNELHLNTSLRGIRSVTAYFRK